MPVQHSKRVSVQLLFFLGFSDFALKLLLGVERVELSVDLFFEHALLDLTALVNQLLLTLDLSAHNVEFGILFAKGVIAHFELLIQLALHKSLAFLFAISLQLLQALVHVLAHLFGCFLLIVEFLLVHAVFSGQKHCEFLTALL